MNKLTLLLLLMVCTRTFSQDSLSNFNYSRNHITLTGMKVLGSWGVVNIGAGAIGWANSSGGFNKYFYQMSTLWGVVNTGVSLLGITGVKNNLTKQLGKQDNIKAQQAIEKTFLINGGIDFVYIGAGIYLNVRGNKYNDSKLTGYGSSVMMQGLFLLLFDATMYNVQKANGRKMMRFLQRNQVTFTGSRVGLVHNF